MAGVKVCSTHLFEETMREKSLVDEALEREFLLTLPRLLRTEKSNLIGI